MLAGLRPGEFRVTVLIGSSKPKISRPCGKINVLRRACVYLGRVIFADSIQALARAE